MQRGVCVVGMMKTGWKGCVGSSTMRRPPEVCLYTLCRAGMRRCSKLGVLRAERRQAVFVRLLLICSGLSDDEDCLIWRRAVFSGVMMWHAGLQEQKLGVVLKLVHRLGESVCLGSESGRGV